MVIKMELKYPCQKHDCTIDSMRSSQNNFALRPYSI